MSKAARTAPLLTLSLCSQVMLMVQAFSAQDSSLPVCSTCKTPVHSWDFVPVFFHGSMAQTDAGLHGGFNEEQLAALTRGGNGTAGYASITIEKWQGQNAVDGFTWEEDAMVVAAKQIKARRQDLAVFLWFDSVRIYTSNHTLNPSAKSTCTTGNFKPAEFLMENPEYLLHNASGRPAVEPWSGCYIYNFERPEVRQFWQEHCLNLTASGVVDGCGADASWQSDPAGGSLNESALKAWDIGHREAMRDLTHALQQGILLGKDPFELGDYVNGVLHEGCDPSNNTIKTLRNLTRVQAQQGRALVYQCHSSGGKINIDELSAFLIGAGVNQYFGFGGWNDNFTKTPHWAPEFERPLGAPLHDATYDEHAGVWSRSFASGTKVSFNAHTNLGSISWAH